MIDSILQKTARRMALHAQLLDGRTSLLKGKEGVAQAIAHLGYVQIDTISVIEERDKGRSFRFLEFNDKSLPKVRTFDFDVRISSWYESGLEYGSGCEGDLCYV